MEKREKLMLTRKQVALALGVPVGDVVLMHGLRLHPVRTKKRTYKYEAEEVQGIIKEYISRSTGDPSDFELNPTALAAFELFEANKSVVAVVIAMKLTLSVVVNLRTAYDACRGNISFTAKDLAEMSAVLGAPITNGHELEAALATALEIQYQAGRVAKQSEQAAFATRGLLGTKGASVPIKQ